MSKYVLKITPDPSSNSVSYSGNYRIFTNGKPVASVTGILSISDSVSIGSGDAQYLNRYFRYSSDRLNWSMWYEFAPDGSPALGLSDIETIAMDPTKGLYVEYKYEYYDGTADILATPLTVDYIMTKFARADVRVSIDTNDMMPAGSTSEFSPAMVFDRSATFNPYDVNNFVDLSVQTSFYVNRTFGLPVLYFRTEPSDGEGDYIFKEWNLYNVVERKCIKVCVPNNDFPDSKLHYNEFGIDYEVPFEVHIDKGYFESMFCPTAEVRKKDFLYFPMLNRMYEIQGSYMFRGMMMRPLYWKAQLVKFKPNINYVMNAEMTTYLDNLLLDSEETLSQVANGDIRDAVLPGQYKTISERFDETRLSLNDSLLVRQERFYFNYAVLIDNYYDFSLVPAGDPAVTYKNTGLLGGDIGNLTFTNMFNIRQSDTALHFIRSNMSGSPDPNVGISIDGMLSGSTLTITVTLNGTANSFTFTGVSTKTWYSYVITVSQEFKQIGCFLYLPVEDVADSLNHNEFSLVGQYVRPIADAAFETYAGYLFMPSPMYIANVRVFKWMINVEDHSYVLSQLYVRDESMIYIIDNCRPQLNEPYVMRAR